MATTKTDYYEVLSVTRNANGDEIKKSFRRLAMEYHPDRNKDSGAEARFKQISEAYEVLSDADKRAAYDRYGHAGLSGFDFGRGFEGAADFNGFGDIFDAFFGGAAPRRAREPQRGGDRRIDIEISFEEAAFGTEREISVDRIERCARCAGNGNEPGSTMARCGPCEGSGQVRRVSKSFFGQFVNIATCAKCRGEGRTITEPCKDCRGQGREKKPRNLAVSIPGGVNDGSRMRLNGEGDAGMHGGPPGHLYVYIAVAEHELFKREEEHLIYELTMNPAQAALGYEAEIPTLDGDDVLPQDPGRHPERPRLHAEGQGRPAPALRRPRRPHRPRQRRNPHRADRRTARPNEAPRRILRHPHHRRQRPPEEDPRARLK